MLYDLIKFPAKLAFLIWCRHIGINKTELLKLKGPLLIAANHPDSFLDAIILCTLFKEPVYALARGDAFKNKSHNCVLRSLKMLPVYRLSEGAENLDNNYRTFADCIDIFKRNGIVLIFSEGRCINEWDLRPLKKGTARLAITAWEQEIPLSILPLGINYQSFTSFGKNIILNFGDPFRKEYFSAFDNESYGTKVQEFNSALKLQLEKLVIKIKPADEKKIRAHFAVTVNAFKKTLLFFPAVIGWLLHAPLYLPVKKFAKIKFGKIDHYDSVVVGMLFLFYPFYLLLISLVIFLITGSLWSFAFFALMPVAAWSAVQLKKQF